MKIDRDDILERGKADQRWLIESAFTIVNKDSKRVPFLLNRAQDDYWGKITARDIVLKARKMGFSTIRLARMLAKCMALEHRHCVVVSHAEDATERLLGRVHDLIENSVLKVQTERKGVSLITFPGTKSRIWIGTAGSRAFGRGDDITDYHLSEYAFWSNPGLITGIEEACVNNSEGCIESTANGWGTPFHKLCEKARKGEKQTMAVNVGPQAYAFHFYDWTWDDNSRIPLRRPVEDLRPEEREIVTMLTEEKGLDHVPAHEFIAWRRAKLISMTEPEKFPQEYPLSPEEAFLVAGAMVFPPMAIQKMEKGAREALWVGEIRDKGGKAALEPAEHGRLTIWLTPKEGRNYVCSADVASGIEIPEGQETEQVHGCYSVLDVFDAETWEQVAQWRGLIPPDQFRDICYMVGAFYNWGLMIPEVNNHGLVVCSGLQEMAYPNLYVRHNTTGGTDLGFYTSPGESGTRADIINAVRAAVRDFTVKINSPASFEDLRTFVRLKNGKLGPQPGCYSDCVFALGIGIVVLEERGHIPEIAKQLPRSGLSISRRGRGSSVSAPARGGYG